MAMRLLLAFVAFAAVRSEKVDTALETDDACAADGDCSLELNQLRGVKLHDAEAAEDMVDEEEIVTEGEEGGACTNSKDLGVWKHGGRKGFDGALNQCGRSCAAGFPCTKDCMSKKGYSTGCASCMAHLVECSRDKCLNQCISNDKSSACTGCVKKSCRPSMKQCSGLNTEHRSADRASKNACTSEHACSTRMFVLTSCHGACHDLLWLPSEISIAAGRKEGARRYICGR